MRRNGLLILAGLLLTAAGAWGGADVPQGVSPGGSRAISRVEARCPTFSWSGVAEVEGYELVVYAVDEAVLEATDALEAEASPPLFRVKVPGKAVSWTPSLDRCLEQGGQYAWFVRAIGDQESGEWSAAMVFEVSSRPPMAEVEEALEVLRRYTGEGPSAPLAGRASVGGVEGVGGRLAWPSLDAEGRLAANREPIPAGAEAPVLGVASLDLDGDVHLDDTSSLFKDGDVFLWDDASNTALGREALSANTTGSRNTASGFEALASNTTGFGNTAGGFQALSSNTTGHDNTAIGYRAMQNNDTGFNNTAIGQEALRNNIAGLSNTATGLGVLSSNTTGSNNTASGIKALASNSTGSDNTATGFRALRTNNTGVGNTAVGLEALFLNSSGSRNVAIGESAGSNATTGSDNIFISHDGEAGEAATIHIGTQGAQTRAFIAGISEVSVSGTAVVVDLDGQLGVVPSAQDFKEEIREMGQASSGLLTLRPVTFRYKPDVVSGPRPVVFGLLAEEVANLYPDLVAYDEEGKPYTVHYHMLIPMLVNELQKQNRQIEELRARLARFDSTVTQSTHPATFEVSP